MNNSLTHEQTAEIRSILAQHLQVPDERLTDGASIMGDLGADSLDVVEIAMNLEESFNLTIPDEMWDRVKTVGDVDDAVAELLAQAGRRS